MKQIEWWPYVGGNELQIFQVANSAITDVSDEFYSDYTIDPSEYRSTVVKAIYSTRKILNTNFREVMADSLIDIAEQESENPAH
jgi:hypothetical protein